jgi:hypothetical protein
VWHQQPYPYRNEEPGGGRSNPTENIPQNRQVSIFEAYQAEREADPPRDEKEAAERGDCADSAPHLRPDAYGNTNDVRPGHALAKADDIGKFAVAYPTAFLDSYLARPDNPTAAPDTAKRDGEERNEERCKRNRLAQLSLLRRLGCCRSRHDEDLGI